MKKATLNFFGFTRNSGATLAQEQINVERQAIYANGFLIQIAV